MARTLLRGATRSWRQAPKHQHTRACSRITAQSLSISAIAEFSGNKASSSAACAWNSRLYSTTGGHAPGPPPSEAPVAHPLSQIIPRDRATRRRLEHPPLYVMSPFNGLELLGQPAGAHAGAAQSQQEQKDCDGGNAVAKRRSCPCRSIRLRQDRAARAVFEMSDVAVRASLKYQFDAVRGGVPVRGKLFQLLAVSMLIISVNSCLASGPSGSREGTDD